MFRSSQVHAGPPLEIVPERPRSTSRWVEAVSHLDAKYGGVSAVVPQLAARLGRAESIAINIAAFCEHGEFHTVEEFPELSLTDWPTSRAAWVRTRKLRERFRDLIETADGIHIHGLWTSSTTVAALAARSLKLPYIISAHGMLEPWALANRALKKRLYTALIERANIHGATCLHALTADELLDYRRFGCKQPIAVIPNGVNIPRSVDANLFIEAFPELRGKQIVLFLGRIHFKKGLDILIQAWSALARDFPESRLVIAGPGSETYIAELRALVASYEISDTVMFTGMLKGEMKWSALGSATGFVLPSYSEGFSVAALEAMGMGLPVIVSDNCHLPEVAASGLGWQIRAEAHDLELALCELLTNAPSDNAKLGNRGRQIVQERYSWQTVAHQMAELYRWVQTGAPPTSFDLQEAKG